MRVLSMLRFLPLLAGLVGPVWAVSNYQKYGLVSLCYLENRRGAGGTSCWLADVQFSCVFCRLFIQGGVLRICMLGKSVGNGRLFQKVHHILGKMGSRSF